MNDLTKYFIDLSKCSEEQQKHIFSLLPEPKNVVEYDVFEEYTLLNHDEDLNRWYVDSKCSINGKTELLYPEFIKLFEGGEDYPGKQYQPLFDHLNSEHGLILHESEMNEIIRIVGGLNSNQ